MDDAEIEALVALMRRHGIAELEHEADGRRLRLRLDGAGIAAAPPDSHSPGPVTSADASSAPRKSGEIRASMAGCFYRAPGPDEDPFVGEGDRVAEGQTLALLEAMKMMTPVEAEAPGIVAQIHAENGAMVARGDLLFTLTAED